MNITIIGTGYVGLVSGACFAELGHHVTCLDKNSKIVSNLKRSKIHFYEPFLEELVSKNIRSQRLSFTTSYKSAVKNHIMFLCIDTPSSRSGAPNLTNLWESINSITSSICQDTILILKSTVPIGTNRKISQYINRNQRLKKLGISVRVCSNPEFLKEGSAVNDFLRPERIIIGSESDSSNKEIADLYQPLNRKTNKIIFMDPASAELSKYAANCFLATKISFINEMAIIADAYKANIHDIRKGIGSDSRIGNEFLYAGLGYGGSCFPKDTIAVVRELEKLGHSNSIVNSTRLVNENQIKLFSKKILKAFESNGMKPKDVSLAIWGIGFKPNTSDIRNSQALALIKILSAKCKAIYIYDPIIDPHEIINQKLSKNINFITNQYHDFLNMDALIICTEWKQFWDPDIEKLKLLRAKIIFDGRNILKRKEIEKHGLTYIGLGS